ncbi:calcium-binding protein [Geminicoccus harenae]|uniref:calcium-binding protein n=1 Tax=Geminicoccus harenae TaxID=2498453 RepID=UPI00168AFE59|nr:calcium-binding protein [Geminicoccus harenae]
MATIFGTRGNDSIQGTAGRDTIFGRQGNDQIRGLASNDRLYGEAGDDHLDGGSGDDVLFGGGGQDTLLGGKGTDTLHGGAGNDWLTDGDPGSLLLGGDGDDQLEGSGVLRGGAGDDFLSSIWLDGEGVDSGSSTLFGDAGDDRIFAGKEDVARGGAGNDTMWASQWGPSELYGGVGDDTLISMSTSQDRAILVGGAGMDTYDFVWYADDANALVVDAVGGFTLYVQSGLNQLDSNGDGLLTELDDRVSLVEDTFGEVTRQSLQLEIAHESGVGIPPTMSDVTLFGITSISADVLSSG